MVRGQSLSSLCCIRKILIPTRESIKCKMSFIHCTKCINIFCWVNGGIYSLYLLFFLGKSNFAKHRGSGDDIWSRKWHVVLQLLVHWLNIHYVLSFRTNWLQHVFTLIPFSHSTQFSPCTPLPFRIGSCVFHACRWQTAASVARQTKR